MLVILANKYKYMNKFALIHLNHINSASSSHWYIKEYYLGIFFFANNLYDYHIKNNPKDIHIAINFIKLAKSDFQKGKSFYPNIFNIFINKILNNKYLTFENREYIQKELNIRPNNNQFLKISEYNIIYDYQKLITNSKSIDNNINNIKYIEKNNIINYTIISIIIICKEYKYLEKTINSIENQNYTNYEIILIYDNNENNDLYLIQQYINKYPNINLVKNNEKRGYLYSIAKGVISSRGEYILTLEPGYALAETNSLKELNYEITNNNNIDIDIIEFNLLLNDDENITNNSLSLYKCEHFESKTSKELFNIKFNKNVSEIDQEKELLSNKLIKANLFKNIINEYELINYSNVIYNYYDNIFLFILSKKNATFKHINKYCLIQYSTNIEYLNNDIHKDRNQTIKDIIFYINFLFDKSNNSTEDKKKVLNEFNNILSVIYNKNQKISKESQELYEKFINCEDISQPDKNLLNFYYQSLLT
jgi:glycosyltransferase involved in cell wall biosynthesis